MFQIPDAPWIRDCERTGYPNYIIDDEDDEDEFDDEEFEDET